MVFSMVDLRSGYHQLKIRIEDVPKTMFTLPITFMSLMNGVFKPFLDSSVIVINDDIFVYSKSEEEHIHHLHIVLGVLGKQTLYAKFSKCNGRSPKV